MKTKYGDVCQTTKTLITLAAWERIREYVGRAVAMQATGPDDFVSAFLDDTEGQ